MIFYQQPNLTLSKRDNESLAVRSKILRHVRSECARTRLGSLNVVETSLPKKRTFQKKEEFQGDSETVPPRAVFTEHSLSVGLVWFLGKLPLPPFNGLPVQSEPIRPSLRPSGPELVLLTLGSELTFKGCVHLRCIQCHVNYIGRTEDKHNFWWLILI